MAELAKIGIDDIVASATEGVLRAMSARKVKVDGIDFKDLVQSGYKVDIIIRAGGPIGGPIDLGGLAGGLPGGLRG